MPIPGGMSDGRAFGLSPYVTESFVVADSNKLRKHPNKSLQEYESQLAEGARQEVTQVIALKKKC